MCCYAWVEITIINRSEMIEYMQKVPKIIKKYKGKYLVRGGKADALEGTIGEHPIKVLIEFPDKESAVRWYESPEYKSIHNIRKDNSTCNFILLPGEKN